MVRRKLTRSAKPLNSVAATSRFSPDTIDKLAADLKAGRLGVRDKVIISDDRQTGLRAIVRASGNISFHVHYNMGDARPYMLVGHYPDAPERKRNAKAAQEAIDDARGIAETVRKLADMGIDPQDGLHERLLRELRSQGTDWRP